MILVDTSVWIDHFRRGNERLKALLVQGQVLMHACVIGEVALGHVKNRNTILSAMKDLSCAVSAGDDELLVFIEKNRLHGLGIGYVDVHLLASAHLMNVRLWTQDKRLNGAALALGLADSSIHLGF